MGGLRQPYAEGGRPLYNFANIGAFTQQTVVHENQCVPIPKAVPLTVAALIGCGVVTGTGAVFNRARVRPGDTVAVIGAGGVGLNVIQAARLAGASAIVGHRPGGGQGGLAREFGATDFVAAGGEGFDMAKAVQSVCPGGVHHAFEVVGVPELLAGAMAMTRARRQHRRGGGTRPERHRHLPVHGPAPEQEPAGDQGRGGPAPPRLPDAGRPLPAGAGWSWTGWCPRTAGLNGLAAAFAALETGAEARTVLLPWD